jgi:hypothetical protein
MKHESVIKEQDHALYMMRYDQSMQQEYFTCDTSRKRTPLSPPQNPTVFNDTPSVDSNAAVKNFQGFQRRSLTDSHG